MKQLFIFLSLYLPLSLWADLSLKHAKIQEVSNINRGFSLVNHQDKTYTFTYKAIHKAVKDPNFNAIRYFQQLQLNDNKTLSMKISNKKGASIEKELHFFMGTQDIQAKVVNDNFIFLVARTAKGDLKIALLDQAYKVRFTQTIQNLTIKAIYNIFSHLDGSYSMALKISNHKNRLTYFNRGTGAENIAILKFSPLLHLMKTHFIGDSNMSHILEVLKDDNDNYYIFNQEDTKSITLYKHDFYKDENKKTLFELKQDQKIYTISTNDYTTFYMGSDRNNWMTLNINNNKIDTYELAKIKQAIIYSIHKLPNNSILISGEHQSSHGESDIFIHNYSPYHSYLWGHTYHSDNNDKVIKHEYDHKEILLTALISDKKNRTNLALFKLNFQGKNTK